MAFGFATKKFAGSPTATLSRLVLYAELNANVLASVPTLLLVRFEMNVVLEYPLAAATGVPPAVSPKNLSKMGNATQPAQPGAKLEPPRRARFFWALRKSCRKPFSKMLTSLMSCARHPLGERLPLYRTSRAVSFMISRSIPKLYWCTYGLRRLGSAVQRPLAELSRKFSLSVIGILNVGVSRGTPPGPNTPTKLLVCGVTPLSTERLAVAISPGLVVPVPKRL